jgi:glycine/D-amino acid oxidase-like deaminating enzyme
MVEGLVLASLHFGFTLSFYVGQLITDLLTAGRVPEPMRPYGIERFRQ